MFIKIIVLSVYVLYTLYALYIFLGTSLDCNKSDKGIKNKNYDKDSDKEKVFDTNLSKGFKIQFKRNTTTIDVFKTYEDGVRHAYKKFNEEDFLANIYDGQIILYRFRVKNEEFVHTLICVGYVDDRYKCVDIINQKRK